jgi:hypothetical protein
MTESLLRRIFVETMVKLGDDGRSEYESLQADAGPEQMETFFREKIQGYDEMVEKIVEEFKKDMLKKNL